MARVVYNRNQTCVVRGSGCW